MSDRPGEPARMNDVLMDLETAAPWLARRVRRVPGPVRGLQCRAARSGRLMFEWQSPAGGTPVDGYRIERTRDGHAYERLAETTGQWFMSPPAAFHDGWFYRVTAVNACGQGSAAWVNYYLRRRRDPILQLVPVRPGWRVKVCELMDR